MLFSIPMNLNKVFVLGNLTNDPELRQIPSGQSVCSFGIATNRFYTDSMGQKQQQAEFHNIVAWGRQAEIIHQYLKKGSLALIEGRLQTRSWQDQQGNRKWKTEIIAERLQLGPKSISGGNINANPRGEFGDSSSQPSQQNQSNQPKQDEPPIIELPSDEEEEIDVKDIPF